MPSPVTPARKPLNTNLEHEDISLTADTVETRFSADTKARVSSLKRKVEVDKDSSQPSTIPEFVKRLLQRLDSKKAIADCRLTGVKEAWEQHRIDHKPSYDCLKAQIVKEQRDLEKSTITFLQQSYHSTQDIEDSSERPLEMKLAAADAWIVSLHR
jgi:hypothetical protein